MEKSEILKITSPEGEDFLIEKIKDNNKLPEIRVYRKVKSAISVAEKHFKISKLKLGRETSLNTREIWNEILKKSLLITALFTLFACSEKNTNQVQETNSITNPTACDCANLLKEPHKEYTAFELNDGQKMREDTRNHITKAKNCVKKYGNLDDFDLEFMKGVNAMVDIPKLDQAIENAKQECFTKKDYSKEEKKTACDCWNNSYDNNHIPYDSMNKDDQNLRIKCDKIFADDKIMKEVCEQNK